MPADRITIFICPPQGRSDTCSAPGCSRPMVTRCSYQLGGAKAGKTCGRPLCSEHCRLVADTCPPHVRMLEVALKAGTRR